MQTTSEKATPKAGAGAERRESAIYRRQVVAGPHDVDVQVRDELARVLLELLRGAGEEREGAVVDRHDVVDAQQARGVRGLVGAITTWLPIGSRARAGL